jgi:AcrR family transcriptional regulator
MSEAMRIPLQDRSRRSLERMLDAGVEALAEAGYDGFSIADVGRRSGVSIGSIYQRFPSKAALFTALQERILEKIDAEQETMFSAIAVADLSDGGIVDAAVRLLARHFHDHEPLLKVMILRGAVDDETRARGSRSSQALSRNFESFLIRSVRRFGHEDPALACDVCFRLAYAGLTRRIISGPVFESPRELDWEALVTELSRACRAYLLSGGHSNQSE